ncbi:hypothetical protein T265_03448 [Opisthorchis viverrini]|uniref:Uncharacterized protein n=1 Tax=Opisthorchis viverrini TaxID=6198 RepID=A0A075AHL3_OPIVI|nr:hypothetical protein T265_03448 [Opisthorchis viverrini]KER30084.1 hypothetical protein T265_03448 [Opisthorchis viverrini]
MVSSASTEEVSRSIHRPNRNSEVNLCSLLLPAAAVFDWEENITSELSEVSEDRDDVAEIEELPNISERFFGVYAQCSLFQMNTFCCSPKEKRTENPYLVSLLGDYGVHYTLLFSLASNLDMERPTSRNSLIV